MTDNHKVLISHINKTRLSNKNQWYYMQFYYKGLNVTIKGFDTWLQRLVIDGVDHSNCMDQKVRDFIAHIDASFNNALKNQDKTAIAATMKKDVANFEKK